MTTFDKTTDELLAELARARREAAAHKAIVQQMLVDLYSTTEYINAMDARARYDQMAEELDAEIRARAVLAFDGKNKNPFPGVKIQERIIAACTDPEAARKYAMENAPALVTVDMGKLGKLAVQLKGTPHELPFYSIKAEPAAAIAQDLDKILVDTNLPF